MIFQYVRNPTIPGEDGKICIWRANDLQLMQTLKSSSRVTAVAAHPSGKILLSAHGDKTIRMWDLTKGTPAWHMKLALNVDSLSWSGGIKKNRKKKGEDGGNQEGAEEELEEEEAEEPGQFFAILPQDGKNVQIVSVATGDVEVRIYI
jgi:hypothetical protein